MKQSEEGSGDYQRSRGDLVGSVCVEAVLKSQEQVNDVVQDVDGEDEQPRQIVQQLCVQRLVLRLHSTQLLLCLQ